MQEEEEEDDEMAAEETVFSSPLSTDGVFFDIISRLIGL
jgi:hypothetical protein